MDKRPLWILFATLFCVMCGFGIVIPALPYFTEMLHGDSRTVGFLLASYSAMNVLCAPFWGRFSDRIGRKPVLLLGVIGLAASFLLFGLSHEDWQLFASRLLGGAFGAAALPTAMAYAGDMSTPEDRAKAMGMMGAGIGLGMVVGPAIGGFAGQFGLQVPFFVSAALSILTAFFILFALPQSKPDETERYGMLAALAMTGKALWPFYLLTFIQMLAFAGMEATFVLYGKDRFGLAIRDIGMMFMAMGLVSAGFQGGGVARLMKRYGETTVTRAGCIVLGLGFLLTPMAPTSLQLLGAFCFFGIGNALIRTSLSTGVSRGAAAGQGTAMGLMQSFDSLARVFGPAIGGMLYYVSPVRPYHAGAGIMALAALISWIALGHQPSGSDHAASHA